MTLKGKWPGCEHTSWAFRNVVHFFCSTLSPPTSLCGSREGAQPRGDRSWVPSSSAIIVLCCCPCTHLADTGHPWHQKPLEEIKLIGCLLEEEVDFVISRDAEGGHEGGISCGAQQRQIGEEVERGGGCCGHPLARGG